MNQLSDAYIVKHIIHEYERLRALRGELEKKWNEIDSLFNVGSNNNNIFDSTANFSAERLTSSIWAFVNSSKVNWFNLISTSKKILSKEEKEWLASVNNILHKILMNPSNGFYHKSYAFYSDLIKYGTAIFLVEEDSKFSDIVYKGIPLQSIVFDDSAKNRSFAIRKISLSVKDAIFMFGESKLFNSINKKNNEDKLTFLHAVMPNSFVRSDKHNLLNMPYVSYYIHLESNSIVSSHGYYEFPYMIARWQTNVGNLYGVSPAMEALPDIKMLNLMSKSIITATQMQLNPTLLASHDFAIKGFKVSPGSIINGGIDPITGNQLVKPLDTNTQLNSSYVLQEQKRESIKEVFYNSLISAIYSNNATATEVLSINENKLRLLGVKVSRIQSEFLYPLLMRTYFILNRLGLLPIAPKSIDVSNVDISFMSIWDNTQAHIKGNNIQSILGMAKALKDIDSNIVNTVNWSDLFAFSIENMGLPSYLINNIQQERNDE